MELTFPRRRFQLMKTHFLLLLLSLVLVACSLPTATPTPLPEPTLAWTVYPTTAVTPFPSPTSTEPAAFVPTLTPLPTFATPPLGLLVHGRVTLDGVGLAGVSIYRKFNAYPNVLIAVTDGNGDYQAFVGIPSDEMTAIIPELAGYTFDPPNYYWRHYHGYEERTFNFTALLTP